MRAAVSAVGDYFRRLNEAASRGWTEFWFRPSDPFTLGLIRLLTGLLLLYDFGIYGLDLHAFLDPRGWFGPDAVRLQLGAASLFAIPALQTSPGLDLAHAAALLTMLCFALGLWTRVTSVLTAVWMLSYLHRAPWVLFGLDQVLAMLVLYLAVSPSGRALSLDNLLRRRAIEDRETGREDPRQGKRAASSRAPQASWGVSVGIRLIQLHICLIYLCSGLGKLQSPNWWNGRALWFVAANYEFQDWGSLTWIGEHPYLLNMMTHGVVLWELAFPILIWNRLLRPLLLCGAVLLHAGIGIFMGMPTFAAAMLIADSSFLDPGWLRRIVGRSSQ